MLVNLTCALDLSLAQRRLLKMQSTAFLVPEKDRVQVYLMALCRRKTSTIKLKLGCLGLPLRPCAQNLDYIPGRMTVLHHQKMSFHENLSLPSTKDEARYLLISGCAFFGQALSEEAAAVRQDRAEALQRAALTERQAEQLRQRVAAQEAATAGLLAASEADRAALASLREENAARERELSATLGRRTAGGVDISRELPGAEEVPHVGVEQTGQEDFSESEVPAAIALPTVWPISSSHSASTSNIYHELGWEF